MSLSNGILDEVEELRRALTLAVSGLSWAVGHIEGAGGPPSNYAARVLEDLRNPRMLVAPVTKDSPQSLDAEGQEHGGSER
jgi:hypothetical protein